MKERHIAHLLPEYLEGLLTKDQEEKVQKHLKNCPDCVLELEAYKELLQAFKSEPQATPAARVRQNFFKHIEEEKKLDNNHLTGQTKKRQIKNGSSYLLKIAAGLALLLSGYFYGSYQQNVHYDKEMALLKEKNTAIQQTAMLSLMENKSASKRIQGVNYIEQLPKPDQDIINALVERMLNDENTNVRLTAVNALVNFTESQQVKNAFIKALKQEQNPNIQIIIIKTLVKMRDKNAVAPMKDLLKEKNTQTFVKDQIRSLIPSIT